MQVCVAYRYSYLRLLVPAVYIWLVDLDPGWWCLVAGTIVSWPFCRVTQENALQGPRPVTLQFCRSFIDGHTCRHAWHPKGDLIPTQKTFSKHLVLWSWRWLLLIDGFACVAHSLSTSQTVWGSGFSFELFFWYRTLRLCFWQTYYSLWHLAMQKALN